MTSIEREKMREEAVKEAYRVWNEQPQKYRIWAKRRVRLVVESLRRAGVIE